MRAPARIALALLLSGCAASGAAPERTAFDTHGVALTRSARLSRATAIRDAAGREGLTNAWLLVAIADAETHLAHCWSEATWACRGPASSDCAGGPILAGAADGPCSARQGGLGMFQFDGGDHDATLRREGDRILTVAGSAAAAVDFAVHMVQRSRFTPVLATREAALAWMNALRLDGPGYHEWIQTVTGYYNGCLPDVCGVYEARYARYDEAHRVVLDELGEAFFFGGLPPEPIVPAGGCAAIEDLPSCNTAGCVWYSCAEACRDSGTPIEVVCPGVGECGDGRCDSTESCGACAADCGACAPVCGNGTCESGESCASCAVDCGSCGPVCGNGTCESGESCASCARDCGSCGPVCGNGTCEGGETCSSCADDCGACGGGGCDVPGHLRTGEGYSACSTPEAWRCAFSDRWDTWTSQVCRGGQWLIYTLDPASCASCCGSWSGACE